MAEGVDDADIARGDGALHGRRSIIVADENGHVVVPHGVYRRPSAAHARIVDNIVMNQRCVMKKLYRRGGVEHAVVDLRAEKARREDEHQRTNLFALIAQVLFNHTGHEFRRTAQAFADTPIQTLEIGAAGFLDVF